jgi:hypothetical protein
MTLQSLLSQPEVDCCVFVAIHIAEGGIVDAFQPPSTTTAQLGIAVLDSRGFRHEIPRIETQNFCTRSLGKALKALKAFKVGTSQTISIYDIATKIPESVNIPDDRNIINLRKVAIICQRLGIA